MSRTSSLHVPREKPRVGATALNEGPAIVLAPAVHRLLKAEAPLDVALIFDGVPPQLHVALAVHLASRPGAFSHAVVQAAVKLVGLDAIREATGKTFARSIARRYGQQSEAGTFAQC